MSVPSRFPPLENYAPPIAPLAVLYRDDVVLVIDKPAGLLSVPGKSPAHADCLEARLQEYDADARLIHRLDMDTSGAMIFARTSKAQRHLGLQFERRHVKKTYVAVVQGQIDGAQGQIDLPLTSDWPNRPLQKICHDTGRAALTHWRVLDREADRTRVELRPETGRTHQLRVHMKALGHPILGDRFYGVQSSAPRLLLHAASLAFYHPDGGRQMEISAPIPF